MTPHCGHVQGSSGGWSVPISASARGSMRPIFSKSLTGVSLLVAAPPLLLRGACVFAPVLRLHSLAALVLAPPRVLAFRQCAAPYVQCCADCVPGPCWPLCICPLASYRPAARALWSCSPGNPIARSSRQYPTIQHHVSGTRACQGDLSSVASCGSHAIRRG